MTGDNRPPGPRRGLGGLPADDPVVAALRGALTREAERVTPSPDGLIRIRDRPSGSGGPGPRRPVAAAARRGGRDRRRHRRAWPPRDRLAWHRVTPAAPGPQHSTVTSTVPSLPVYYPGAQGAGYGLFREFHPTGITQPAARLQAAVTRGAAARPDASRLPAGLAPGAAAVATLESATSQQPALIRVTRTGRPPEPR